MKKKISVLITSAIVCVMMLVSGISVNADTSSEVPADGLYKVDVPDPAPMCKILAEDNNTCNLLVKDGKMTAIFRLNSNGYDKVFVGTKEEAAAADPSEWIYRTEEKITTVDEEGEEIPITICSYEIPVSALGTDISVATHSIAKGDTDGANYVKGWYDRTFNFSNPRAFSPQETAALYIKTLDIPKLVSDKESLQASYDDLLQKYNEAVTAKTAAEKAKTTAEKKVTTLNSKITVMSTKVSGVKATAYSSSHKITVKWTKNSKVAGYKVYRATSLNGTYNVVKTTTSTTATITGHKKGRTYYYKVVGYKKISGSTVYTKDSAIRVIKAK
ncbi:MAG: hypothetical protein ACI4LD_04445 [Lentihominibacter sp.]